MASRYSSPTVKVLYALVALAAVVYLVWPYGTLARLYLALKRGDAATVQEMVAWPLVRDGFNVDVDRFLRRQASRHLSLDGGRMSVTLEFNSSSLGRELAKRLATPQAVILLFRNPGILACIGNSLDLGTAEAIAGKCSPGGLNGGFETAAGGAAAAGGEIEGPNIVRLFEKTDYAFFTGLFSFRLDILHEGVPVEIRLRRAGIGWKVTRILASLAGGQANGR